MSSSSFHLGSGLHQASYAMPGSEERCFRAGTWPLCPLVFSVTYVLANAA